MRVLMDAHVNNSFGVPCTARLLIDAEYQELPHAAELSVSLGYRPIILGAGTNVLLPPQIGAVIRVAGGGPTLEHCPRESDAVAHVWVSASAQLDDVVAASIANGWYGLECLSGIPGTVGGAIAGNVGAYGQQICDVVSEVVAYHFQAASWGLIPADRCEFGYRRSRFATDEARDNLCIARVRLRLGTRGIPCRTHEDVALRTTVISPLPDIRTAVLHARARKGMLEAQHRSAGSFFKNPIVPWSRIPEGAPHWAAENSWKVAAAWLVEHAGISKGYRRGNAGVSPDHALSLISVGEGATSASEIAMLAREIQERVADRFGILLEPEVRLIGFNPYPLL